MQENILNYSKEIEKHLTTITKQFGIVFTGKFIGYFLGFVSNFILARYFGPKILGQYTLILVTVNTLSVFTVFGFNNGLTNIFPDIELPTKAKK